VDQTPSTRKILVQVFSEGAKGENPHWVSRQRESNWNVLRKLSVHRRNKKTVERGSVCGNEIGEGRTSQTIKRKRALGGKRLLKTILDLRGGGKGKADIACQKRGWTLVGGGGGKCTCSQGGGSLN